MRTKVFIILMSFVCCMANADVLNVWKTTGDKVLYDFSKKPEIKYVTGMIVISTINGEDKYSPDEVQGFTFNDNSFISGAYAPTASGIQLRITESAYTVSGLKEGTLVNVFDGSGRTVFTTKAKNNGSVTISSDKMANGINFIQAGTSTFKTIKQ